MNQATEQIKKNLVPALLTGAVAWAGAKYVLGLDGLIIVNDKVMSTSVIIGAGAGLGMLAGELSVDYVLPLVQGKLNNMEAQIVPPAMSAIGTYVALNLVAPASMVNSMAIGAVASMSGKYLNQTLWGPKY